MGGGMVVVGGGGRCAGAGEGGGGGGERGSTWEWRSLQGLPTPSLQQLPEQLQQCWQMHGNTSDGRRSYRGGKRGMGRAATSAT